MSQPGRDRWRFRPATSHAPAMALPCIIGLLALQARAGAVSPPAAPEGMVLIFCLS